MGGEITGCRTTSNWARDELIAMARRTIAHVEAGTIPRAGDVMTIPADRYDDPARWRAEVEVVFKRLPLVLALSSELSGPGDHKAMTVCGVPVLIVRHADGGLRAHVNMCSHRGAQVVPDGAGSARRFSCPYHAWTYDHDGTLVGVTNRGDFGDVDVACLGLTPLPVDERCGFVWVVLTPGVGIDLDAHLGRYAELLDHFDFGSWHVIEQRRIDGPNWKLAYDGYLDFYHLPFLHRDTFGPDMSSRPIYDAWGPHQRMTAPHERMLALRDLPDEAIDLSRVDGGVWTIFPHVSIAGFPAGSRGMLVSQLFPGDRPERSVTIQNFVVADEPTDELRAETAAQADFFEHVVRDEDYATGFGIQSNVATRAKPTFVFGRNEGGGQTFHRHLDALLAAAGHVDGPIDGTVD